MLTTMMTPSPFGPLCLVADGAQLVGLDLPDRTARAAAERRSEVLERAAAQLTEYFAGRRRGFDLPLALRGTPFQTRVWRALLQLPFGVTCSYGELARAIGKPSASRAVGAANGQNPIAIIVPCHRVIGSTGELTGYGGGLAMKRWLLDHERAGAGAAARGAR